MIGEELGFIGCVIVIILFLLIVYECLMMAARAKDLAGRLICTGMATLIAFQIFVILQLQPVFFPIPGFLCRLSATEAVPLSVFLLVWD